jgi:hypothetical protein
MSLFETLDENLVRVIRYGNDVTPLRTFLIGPKKCGKTSIAMDLAHSIVCQSLPVVKSTGSINSKEDTGVNTEKNRQPPVKVVFIRHASTVTNNDQEDDGSSSKFPMKFYPKQPDISDGTNKDWNKEALSHISIYYPANFTELVQLLSSIQLICSEEEKFVGGILVDDLDQFLPHHSSSMAEAGRSTTPTTATRNTRQNENLLPMMLLQILALAIDAAACIDDIQSKHHQISNSTPCNQSVKVVLTMSDVAAKCVQKPMLMTGMSCITTISSPSLTSKDANEIFEICMESAVSLNNAKATYMVHVAEEACLSLDHRNQIHRAQWTILE